jgi:hypothetical protein
LAKIAENLFKPSNLGRSGDTNNPRMAVETYKEGGIGQVLEFHSSIALNNAQVLHVTYM